eukprot:scaffold1738_cov73-Phaeocystis_antarctica.AAC.6
MLDPSHPDANARCTAIMMRPCNQGLDPYRYVIFLSLQIAVGLLSPPRDMPRERARAGPKTSKAASPAKRNHAGLPRT